MDTHPARGRATSAANGSSNVSRMVGDAWVAVLLRLDGSFEAMLGIVLIATAATSLYRWLDLPAPPAGRPVLLVVGILLLALGAVLWRLSQARRPDRLLRELAIANLAGALLFGLWVSIWNHSFHPVSAIFVLLIAGILASVGGLQARVALARR